MLNKEILLLHSDEHPELFKGIGYSFGESNNEFNLPTVENILPSGSRLKAICRIH